MTQLWKLRSAIISGEDFSLFFFQPNGQRQNIENSSLHMIADQSFQGCIAKLIFYILLSGEKAKSLFEKLKKKYSKKKIDLKRAKKLGSWLQDTQRAEPALAPYIFLSWLHDFTKFRHCKSNIEVDWSDSQNIFGDLSGNTNVSNIDDTNPSSCAETPEESGKERHASNTFLMNKGKWNCSL